MHTSNAGAHGPTSTPVLPGVPQHVVQRGNNRLPCFLGCLHAYVLMSNHVPVLMTAEAGAGSRLMHTLAR